MHDLLEYRGEKVGTWYQYEHFCRLPCSDMPVSLEKGGSTLATLSSLPLSDLLKKLKIWFPVPCAP